MTDAPTPAGAPPPPSGVAIGRKELEARIIANAWRDPAYHAALLANPKAVLQQELAAIDPSIVLPDALAVHVHAEDATTYHLVEPRNPNEVAPPASDEQMGQVSPQTVAVITGTNPSAVVVDGYLVLGPVQTVIVNAAVISGGPVPPAVVLAQASVVTAALVA